MIELYPPTSPAAALSLAPSHVPSLAPSGLTTPWLFRFAVAVLLFNLLDGVLTLALVDSGLATEANPMMAELLGRGAIHFMVYKIALVSLSILLCWRLRHVRIACFAIYGTAATYALLALYHVKSVSALAHFLL